MAQSGVSVLPDCITKFNELKLGKSLKYIIYKISDNGKEIEVEDTSSDGDYETFRNALVKAKDASGKPLPRYAVYDFAWEAEGGGGKRSKITFIAWSPDTAGIKPKMVYSSSKDALKRALNGIGMEHQANDEDEIEYETLLAKAVKTTR